MEGQIESLKDVEKVEDLALLKDNSQKASDIFTWVFGHPKFNFRNHVTTILAKLRNGETVYIMISLVAALKNANPDLKFTEEQVTTILEKVGENQYAFNMADLVNALKNANPDLKFTEEQVTTILEKLEENRYAFNMADLVNALKKDNQDLKFNENQVNAILGKLKGDQSASYMVKLVNALKESGVNLNEYVEKILEKLGKQKDASDMANLVNALKKSNVDITNHVETILAKVDMDTAVVPMIKLAIELKESNPNLKFSEINNAYSLIKSLDKDGVFTKEDKNNEENNQIIEGKPNKKVLANAIMRYFEYELQNLEQHPDQIDSKKEVWLQIADDLKKEEILDKDGAEQFKNQVKDIHDLSLLATFVQWLGCVLSAFLVVPVIFSPVRNRIIHPENRCIFERLQDKKNELIAPLQEIVTPQKNNKHEIN